MIDLTINHLKKEYFAGPVFDDVSLEVKHGERIGFLGDNGTGKSTVFRIIIGEETYNGGEVFKRSGLKVGIMRQEVKAFPGLEVVDVIREAFREIDALADELKVLEEKMSSDSHDLERNLKNFGELQERFELMGGYQVDDLMKRICKGIKIDSLMLKKPFDVLSGGEKSRVMLAKLLLESPDLMLLDEPTNHLDLEMIEWLESFLNDYEGSVLIISHDRYFLDRVIHKVYEIKNGATRVFHGNFSYYLEERERIYEIEKKQFDQQQKKIKQLETAAKRMRVWANQADNEAMYIRAKAIEKRIEKMDKLDRPLKDTNNVNINFQMESQAGKVILEGKDYHLSIGERTLLKNASFKIMNGEVVGVIGPNGCGKSTMVKDILKRCHADEYDTISINPRAKIGYLEQDITFIEPNRPILEVFKDYHPDTDGAIRNYLATFNFKGEEVFIHVNKMSGGEKVRLMLAIMLKRDINVLVLDEPSNHIDIKTREVLEKALIDFQGTILFISHDRYLLNQLADKIIAFESESLVTYHGNYQEVIRERHKREERLVEQISKKEKSSKVSEKPKQKKVNKYKLAECESAMQTCENAIESLKNELSTLVNEYVRIQEVTEELEQKEKELEALMEEYFMLTEV